MKLDASNLREVAAKRLNEFAVWNGPDLAEAREGGRHQLLGVGAEGTP